MVLMLSDVIRSLFCRKPIEIKLAALTELGMITGLERIDGNAYRMRYSPIDASGVPAKSTYTANVTIKDDTDGMVIGTASIFGDKRNIREVS